MEEAFHKTKGIGTWYVWPTLFGCIIIRIYIEARMRRRAFEAMKSARLPWSVEDFVQAFPADEYTRLVAEITYRTLQGLSPVEDFPWLPSDDFEKHFNDDYWDYFSQAVIGRNLTAVEYEEIEQVHTVAELVHLLVAWYQRVATERCTPLT